MMTTADIHKIFDTVMDKNSVAAQYGGCPAFLPKEKDIFLNLAYLEEIVSKYNGGANRIGFEGSGKRTSDLQKLIVTDTMLNLTRKGDNSYLYKGFSNNNKRLILTEGVLRFDTKSAPCMLVNHNIANRFKAAYNNNPWIDIPIMVQEDDNIVVYVDMYNMKASKYALDITYLKYPTKIDSSDFTKEITDVPDTMLNEVINRAVALALENIESQRTATKVQLNLMAE